MFYKKFVFIRDFFSSSDLSKVNAKTSTTHFRYRRRSGSNDSIDNNAHRRKPNNYNSTQDQIRKQMISGGNSFLSSPSFSYEDDDNYQ